MSGQQNISFLKRKSRAAGLAFEEMIKASCKFYEAMGEAKIDKTPEPTMPIRALGKGQFLTYFVKKAQPDFKGVIKGGQAVVFEAKHTDTDKMSRSKISYEQEKELDVYEQMGAECYVLVSFGFRKFYKFPWKYFRDMDWYLGRKHIKETDFEIKEYEIKYINGVLRFLYQ